MISLLHISASPRGPRSESLAIATTFLDELRATNPYVTIEHWDLWDGTLPAFGPPAAAAKMAVFAGADPEGDEATAWRAARETFERFDSADYYLFTVPMWNASVPYILKQLIDVISQPGMIFGFDPTTGYTGLLENKRAAVIYTGAVYDPTAAPPSATTSSSPTSRTGCTGRRRRHPQHRLPAQPRHRRPGAGTPRRAPTGHPDRPRIPLPRRTGPPGGLTYRSHPHQPRTRPRSDYTGKSWTPARTVIRRRRVRCLATTTSE